jgi:hypothetical protein
MGLNRKGFGRGEDLEEKGKTIRVFCCDRFAQDIYRKFLKEVEK